MKKFTINCTFGGTVAPFTVYIGNPETKHHPLHFQAEWLSKERGGSIPPGIMDSLMKLKELADRNGVPFEELCAYALEAAAAPSAIEGDHKEPAPEASAEQTK